MNQVSLEQQVKRPPFIKPSYISIGGLSYNIVPAVEKFRLDERMKHTVHFQRPTVDYVYKKDSVDLRKLMVKRRKEGKRQLKQAIKTWHLDKCCI